MEHKEELEALQKKLDEAQAKEEMTILSKWVRPFFNDKKNIAIVFLSVVALGSFVHNFKQEVKAPVITKEVKQEVKQMVLNDNLYCLDLSKLEKSKVEVTNIHNNDGTVTGERIKVWYKKQYENGNATWITLKEVIMNKQSHLKRTAKDYENYLEEQSKKIQESK